LTWKSEGNESEFCIYDDWSEVSYLVDTSSHGTPTTIQKRLIFDARRSAALSRSSNMSI
jgi:hypothetical protein